MIGKTIRRRVFQLPALTSAQFANRYRDFLGDGAKLPALRKRYEALIGPVVNKATQ